MARRDKKKKSNRDRAPLEGDVLSLNGRQFKVLPFEQKPTLAGGVFENLTFGLKDRADLEHIFRICREPLVRVQASYLDREYFVIRCNYKPNKDEKGPVIIGVKPYSDLQGVKSC